MTRLALATLAAAIAGAAYAAARHLNRRPAEHNQITGKDHQA